MSGDITNQVEVRKIFDRIKENHKKIDVVINCAGIFSEKPLEKTSVEEFNGVLQTNLIGPFIICQQVIPIMKLSRSGLIINIGSKISHNTNLKPNKVVYSSTKYAIEGFSFALSKELKSFGIRVCCLMPGTINTFISRNSKNFMSPYDVAHLIKTIIKLKDLDFESVIFKSLTQEL
jgi:3-oxoacyl-[acyl-carrier protein] reductase